MVLKHLGHIVGLVGGGAIVCLSLPAFANPRFTSSVGEPGIDALRLHQPPYDLLGRKIAIGQVEIGRPGIFGFDKSAAWQPPFNLSGVFYRDRRVKSNENVDEHAAMVAAIMVSRAKQFPGVAPQARLYSAAVGIPQKAGQPEECLTAQHVALQNGKDVRAINFSFGEPLNRDPRPQAVLDGNALLTQCIDWSSRVHNTLYVVAGNQGKGGIPIPTDNFNGLNVAYTTRRFGVFDKVDFANLSTAPVGISRRILDREINVGPRRSINIVAPGSFISTYNLRGKVTRVTGTSFAAPHVTATVALLQEFGDRQLVNQAKNWSLASRRHEVSKAVLLNSADKLKDVGNGLLLGMKRTIVNKDNSTWLQSDAHRDPKIPLDYEMGTGQLNAYRAYQQFSAGQWQPNAPVPAIGWNYTQISSNQFQDYAIDQPLQQGSVAAITLAWDRRVELQDKNNNQQYDIGETFTDRGLNNLDIYLLPADENDLNKAVWSSQSSVDSVEHLWATIPATGRYKIRVKFRDAVHEPSQSYAIAWWTVPSDTSSRNSSP